MSSSTYLQIRTAVKNKQQMIATYGGHYREMCPHAIGLGPLGNEQVLVYQFAGMSSKGDVLSLPDQDRWRCLPIDGLNELEIRDGEWHTSDNHSAMNTCIQQIDLEVDY